MSILLAIRERSSKRELAATAATAAAGFGPQLLLLALTIEVHQYAYIFDTLTYVVALDIHIYASMDIVGPIFFSALGTPVRLFLPLLT